MNYFRYGTLQLSTVEFPMYLSFVKYSSVDTFFSQDKYEKFKSQKETFQGEGERLFGFHDNICFKQILVDLFSQFHPTVALETRLKRLLVYDRDMYSSKTKEDFARLHIY